MTSLGRALAANVRWELLRWRRSRRLWLLAIPPVAGPVGSAIADLYLRIPSVATAEILGLLITGGLGGLIGLDLAALSVGEELATREYLVTLSLPQSRGAAIAGRILPAVTAPIAAYALGAALVFLVAPATVAPAALAPVPLFAPGHLALALVALLVFLGGVSAAGAVVARSSAQGLAAGVLAGVLVAGVVGLLVFQHEVTWFVPAGLAVGGVGSLGFAIDAYGRIDS